MRDGRRKRVFYWLPVRFNLMKIVPVIRSSNLQRSIHFYTQVLDFDRKWPGHEDIEMRNGLIELVLHRAELQLSRHSEDGVFGSVNRVFVDDVHERNAAFRARACRRHSVQSLQFTPRRSIRRGDCGSSR